jgi:hypothetical protein
MKQKAGSLEKINKIDKSLESLAKISREITKLIKLETKMGR